MTISWAQATLSRHSWMASSSFRLMLVTKIPAAISATPFPTHRVSGQPLESRLENRVHLDVLHRLRRALNRPDPWAIWTVPLGTGWPVKADGGHTQGRRHMQGAGIAAHGQVCPVEKRREIGKGGNVGENAMPGEASGNTLKEVVFRGGPHQENIDPTLLRQALGQLAIIGRRPLFGAAACGGEGEPPPLAGGDTLRPPKGLSSL